MIMGSATKAILGSEHDLIETVGLTNQFHAYKSLYESHMMQLLISVMENKS